MKWEYKKRVVQTDEIDTVLEEEGECGWEVINIDYEKYIGHTIRFKRQKQGSAYE